MKQGAEYDYIPCTKVEFLAKFPPKELYRLFVDGTKQRDGWKKFEDREPGYLGAMFKAFFVELENLDEPLSADVIKRIHKNAIEGVKLEGNVDNAFREANANVGFNLHLSRNLSAKGIQELKVLQKQGVVDIVETQFSRDNKKHKTLKLVGYQGDIEQKVNEIIADYHQAMLSAKSIDEKVTLIVKMIANIERIHPFKDANCRTLCMTLLYRELLKIGLMLPILNNPNEFDGFSVNELCQRIQEGMARSVALIDGMPVRPFFTMGLLSPKVDPQAIVLPEDVQDLTKIDDYNAIDGPYNEKYDLIHREKEDELVYKMILMEAASKNHESDVVGNSPFFAHYQEMMVQFCEDIAQNDALAKERFLEAIKFGCNNQVKYILTQLKQKNLPLGFVSDFLVDCYKTANNTARSDMLERIKILMLDIVHRSVESGANDVIPFLKKLYHVDPKLYEEIVIYIEHSHLKTKPDVSTPMNILMASKQAEHAISSEMNRLRQLLLTGNPNLFKRWSLSGDLTKLEGKLDALRYQKSAMLLAANSDQAALVAQLVEKALKREVNDEMSLYTHFQRMSKKARHVV